MAKKHLTLRVDEPVVDALDRCARMIGLSRSELADRYITEGVRLEGFPRIYFRDGVLGRRAALVGTRLDVWQVVETVRNHDNSVSEAADYLGIDTERVWGAVQYAAAHPDEIAEILRLEAEAADQAEARWRAAEAYLAS